MEKSILQYVSSSKGIVLFVAIMFFVTGSAFGQQKKDPEEKKLTDSGKSNFFNSHTPRSKDFHAVGHSLFFDLNLGPIQTYAPDTTDLYDTTTKFSRVAEYSFYNISYYLRFNVYQPDDNKAVSLTINPALGLGFSQSKRIKGFGVGSGAAYVGYEWGLGSTYRTDATRGGFIRLGAEYYYTPIIVDTRARDDRDIRSWISPVISFGSRRESAKERLIESNFKIGWGLNRVDDVDNGVNPYMFSREFSFRYSIVVYLDY